MAVDGKLLLRFVLLQSLVVGALCCVCPAQQHPQRIFCENDYTLKAYIGRRVWKPNGDGPYVYKFFVDILKVYRGEISELDTKKDRIKLGMSRFCGIDSMEVGQTWIIFAKNKDGFLHTDLCSGSILLSETWKFLRRGLNYNYEKGCSCMDKNRFKFIKKDQQCKMDYSYVRVLKNGNCGWDYNMHFKRCLRQPRYFS